MPPYFASSSSTSSSSPSASSVHQASSPCSSSILSSSSPPASDHWGFTSPHRDSRVFSEVLARELKSCSPSCMPLSSSSSYVLPSSFSKPIEGSETQALASDNCTWRLSYSPNRSIFSLQAVHSSSDQWYQEQGRIRSHGVPPLPQQQAEMPSITTVSNTASPPPGLYDTGISGKKFLMPSQASVGIASSRACKKRSRPSNKAPVTVLMADVSNFRDMVQQLTGISSPVLSPKSRFKLIGSSQTNSCVPLLQPLHRTGPASDPVNGLPTTNTSGMLLSSLQSLLPEVHSSTSLLNQLIPFSNAAGGLNLRPDQSMSVRVDGGIGAVLGQQLLQEKGLE